jgi:FemAB-related protein (PEP-CTERM system-associated)
MATKAPLEGLEDVSGRTLESCHASRVEVRELQPGEEETWDQFVSAAPGGTFFHLSRWKTVIEKILRRPCHYLMATAGDRVRGVFPIAHVRSKLFGNCLVSSPLAVYGGICADDRDSYFSLLQAGSDLAARLGVNYLEMRNQTEPYPTSLPGRDLYVTFTQDLSPGPEKLLQGLPRDTRYAIRKSQKSGLEWTEDLTIREFYEIYAQSVHRLGTPVFPRELFDCLKNEFSGRCRLFGVRKGKTAIAGVLCFYFRDQVLPYYGGALAEYYKDSPNNFMYWNLIAQSCKEGYRHFDFGRSKRGTGSFSFKSAWSMQVTELPYRYHLVRAKQVPQLSPVDQKLQLPVAIWKRLPFGWTKVLGPRLIRWIPSI